MSAAETIQKAIEKLEQLKADSTQPTDGNAWIQGRESRRYESEWDVYTGPNENTPGSADIVTYIDPVDAELIVTLHRTIDAQLALLKWARWVYLNSPASDSDFKHEVTLAKAILGGAE